jgi:general secretion pathway protein B
LPAASPPVSAEVPFLRSLPDELRRSLPEMTVNIHVYTPEASRRLLYINNREYHKGEYIGGVLIEDVLPDGALMNYQGIRFKLERPR